MSATTWEDLGIVIPYGMAAQVRTTCPKCTPSRKPGNQRRRDLSVNTVDNGRNARNHGKIGVTKYEMPPAVLETLRGPTRKELSPVRDQCIPSTTEDTTESLPRTRSEALAAGAKRYFTGRPCPHGHVAPRFTSNFGCESCLLENSRQYHGRNKARMNERCREYARRDPEGNHRRTVEWAKSNPAKQEVLEINAGAKRRGATGVVTVDEWVALKHRYGNRCARCGASDVKIGADHVVPISKGGTNTIDNIQPLCFPCNQAKWQRSTDYREQVQE